MSTDLLTRDGARAAQGGVRAYLSPSRLNCWLTCPLKFKAIYLDGLRPPPTPSLFLGKLTHLGLQLYYRHRHLGLTLDADDVSRRMLESWGAAVDEESMKFDSAEQEQALQQQAVGLVSAYVRQVPADEPRPLAVEVTCEAPLVDHVTGEDLGIPLLGIMDLILGGIHGLNIIDFKTTGRSSEPLEITHEIQLSSYAWLFRQLQGRPEAGLEIRSLIKTKMPKIEAHAYPARTEAHFRRLFAVIREYLDALDSGRFNYRPGFGCSMCDHREKHCRSWAG